MISRSLGKIISLLVRTRKSVLEAEKSPTLVLLQLIKATACHLLKSLVENGKSNN